MADKNAEGSFWVSSRNRLFKSLVRCNMLPAGKTRLLEIGCERGEFIEHLVEDQNLEITGSEIFLRGLAYAKKNLPQVEFVQFDVTEGMIGDRFDMIAAFDVIEHIENDAAAISNIGQMLDKGRAPAAGQSEEQTLEKRVKFSGILNSIFDLFMGIDEIVIRLGTRLSCGPIQLVVAREC